VHYIFETLIRTRPDLAELWARVPVWPVLPTHALQHARFHSHMKPDDFRAAVPRLLRQAPVQKINWRHEWPDEVFAPVEGPGVFD
jgi:hypothetical protein